MRIKFTECYLGLASEKNQLEQINASLEAILQKYKKSKTADDKTRSMSKNLGLKYLIRKFDWKT